MVLLLGSCKKNCEQYIVEGYITNGNTGKPIKDADVEINNSDKKPGFGVKVKSSSTKTDASGYYKIQYDCKSGFDEYHFSVREPSNSLYNKEMDELDVSDYWYAGKGNSNLRKDFLFSEDGRVKVKFVDKPEIDHSKVYLYYKGYYRDSIGKMINGVFIDSLNAPFTQKLYIVKPSYSNEIVIGYAYNYDKTVKPPTGFKFIYVIVSGTPVIDSAIINY